VLQCSFFVDVALKLWKVSSAGRSRAGWRRNWVLRKKSKVKRNQIVSEKQPKIHNISLIWPLSASASATYEAKRRRSQTPAFASRRAKDTSSEGDD
jgi:hypothetical protein